MSPKTADPIAAELRSKTVSFLPRALKDNVFPRGRAVQFINMSSTHSPNSFLTWPHRKPPKVEQLSPRQTRFLKMALEKDNKGHREMSDKMDEKYKDSNVWNKVIDLLFVIIFYWLKLLYFGTRVN